MRLVISGQQTAADAPDYPTAIQLPFRVSCRITGGLNRILLPYSLNPSIACPSWAENIWLEAVLKANEAAVRLLLLRRMKSPMGKLFTESYSQAARYPPPLHCCPEDRRQTIARRDLRAVQVPARITIPGPGRCAAEAQPHPGR